MQIKTIQATLFNVAFLLAFTRKIKQTTILQNNCAFTNNKLSPILHNNFLYNSLKTKKNKMTFKTALMYAGVIVASILIAELVKPSVNKMLGR